MHCLFMVRLGTRLSGARKKRLNKINDLHAPI
jgi:hypothetical protein